MSGGFPVMLLAGLLLLYLALFLIIVVVLRSRSVVPLSRRRPGLQHASGLTKITDHAVGSLNKSMKRSGGGFLSRERLDECGLKKEPGDYLLIAGMATFVATVLAFLLGGWFLALLLAIGTPLALNAFLGVLASRRRNLFDDQVPDALQMLAGGLRAGHSLLRAVDAAGHESQPPMSEELSRVVNETRIGRDLGESLADVALRTRSEDFSSIGQAIEIHREVGGDLAEVLDHLWDTVRDRNQVRGQIRALSAEGRISALVLMALPVVMFIFLTLFNSMYARVFMSTVPGFIMIGVGLLLMTLGGLWLKQLIKPKF